MATEKENWRVEAVTQQQWEAVLGWAQFEHWDIGEGDAGCFFNADDRGFFMGFVNDQPVASVSIVNHSDSYAHIGHYLTAPEFRGQGWGLKVWSAALEHGGDRTLGGDGMPVQERNYNKWGMFSHYRTLRLIGKINQHAIRPAGVEPVTEENIAEVIDYDQVCLGIRRTALLADWFWGAGRWGFVTQSVQGINGLLGVRRSTEGYRLGPLYADNPAVLEDLFVTALAELPMGAQLTLDAPETDMSLIQLARRHGLQEAFYTLRIYRGPAPKGQQKRVKAIASLELG